VLLASGPSVEALRLSWSLLLDRHRSLLKGLEPRTTTVGEGERGSLQLLAGPLGSPDDAARVCAQLRAKRVTCTVAAFAGQPM
jgi:hypothetical protein